MNRADIFFVSVFFFFCSSFKQQFKQIRAKNPYKANTIDIPVLTLYASGFHLMGLSTIIDDEICTARMK